LNASFRKVDVFECQVIKMVLFGACATGRHLPSSRDL